MRTPTNLELLRSALADLTDVMDYVASESGDCNILNWLKPVEENITTVLNRYGRTVEQQTTPREFLTSRPSFDRWRRDTDVDEDREDYSDDKYDFD